MSMRNKIPYDGGHTGKECDFRTASRPPTGKPAIIRHISFPGKTGHALPRLDTSAETQLCMGNEFLLVQISYVSYNNFSF